MPLPRVSKKRAAQIASGEWKPKPRKPIARKADEGKDGRKSGTPVRSKPLSSTGRRGTRLAPALAAAYEVAKARSGGVCQVCAKVATEVHHLHSRGAAANVREDAANLAHVCKACHDRFQPDGARFRQLFARDWPYFRAIYNAALDELKVGRLVGDVFVPLAALPHDVGEEGA